MTGSKVRRIPTWCINQSQSCWFTMACCQTRNMMNNGPCADFQENGNTQTNNSARGCEAQVWCVSRSLCRVFRVGRWIRSGCSERAECQNRDRTDTPQFCMSNSQQLLKSRHLPLSLSCSSKVWHCNIIQHYCLLLSSVLLSSFSTWPSPCWEIPLRLVAAHLSAASLTMLSWYDKLVAGLVAAWPECSFSLQTSYQLHFS